MLNLALVYNYGFNISRLRIADAVIIKFCTFGYYAFNLNRMLKSGNVETAQELKNLALLIFYWYLKGVAAHGFVKMSLIKALITVQNFDIVCFSETFLDSSTDMSDNRRNLNDYTLFRADCPSNIKRGGVSTYIKTICYRELTCLIFRNIQLLILQLAKKKSF